jgi:hypothetical protein
MRAPIRIAAVAASAAVATLATATAFLDRPGGDARAAERDGGVRVEQVDPDDPIASVKAASPAGGTLTVDLLSLHTRGDLAILWLAYTIDEGDDMVSAYDMGGDRSPAPELIDLENLRRHEVVRDSGLPTLQSDAVFNKARVGEPLLAHYVFAAPADGVDEVDVRVWEFLPAFEDVPVERGA